MQRVDTETVLSVEQQGLIEKWIGLVAYVLRKRPNTWCRLHNDDAYSVGVDALIRASQLFDPGRGVKFNTYAVASISKQLWRENERAGVVRRKSGAKYGDPPIRCYSIDTERSVVARGEACQIGVELESRESAAYAEFDVIDEVRVALRCLPPRYRTVVEMHLDGATLREIGNTLGLSHERARQIKSKAMAKLATRLAHLGEEA